MSSSSTNIKKRIAFTLGDLGGIGPEIYKKFTVDNKDEEFDFLLIDEKLDYQRKISKIKTGTPSKISGEHAAEALALANELCLKGECDYLITGPVAKESLWLAGIQVSGQTELLAKLNGLNREQIEMFFVLNQLRTVLATRHIPIKDVANVLEERLSYVLENSLKALREIFKIQNPSIAVAGLNPHAGENGIIGLEEKKFITKTVNDFSKQHPEIKVTGPVSADSLLAMAAQKYLNKEKVDYDLYVAAYHDQVLPLIKGLGGLKAINLTVGLPYIRLSVDHGTGFDIVGKKIASAEGFESCLHFCKNTENIVFSSN